MVGGGGAAREEKLGHGQRCRKVKRFWRKPGPNGIERVEPRKQFAIKRGRSRKRLKEMMMGIDQSGQHHMGARLKDHGVRDNRYASAWHELSDAALPHHHAPSRVVGQNGQGILDPECSLFVPLLSFRCAVDCSPHERSEMRGTDPDIASLIRGYAVAQERLLSPIFSSPL